MHVILHVNCIDAKDEFKRSILLTDSCTFLVVLFVRIQCYIKVILPSWWFSLFSHHLSSWQCHCANKVRRNQMLITFPFHTRFWGRSKQFIRVIKLEFHSSKWRETDALSQGVLEGKSWWVADWFTYNINKIIAWGVGDRGQGVPVVVKNSLVSLWTKSYIGSGRFQNLNH